MNYIDEIKELVEKLLTKHNLKDYVFDNNIYYYNGNDGTEFDLDANGRTCEFFVWSKDEYGLIKMWFTSTSRISKSGKTIIEYYVYDPKEWNKVIEHGTEKSSNTLSSIGRDLYRTRDKRDLIDAPIATFEVEESNPEKELDEEMLTDTIIENNVLKRVDPENQGEFIIPDSVEKIDYLSFYGCSKITSIIIPSSVKIISQGGFCGCTALKSIEIPNSVTDVNSYFLFDRCYSLTSVKLPNTLKNIGTDMFAHCTSFKRFDIPDSINYIEKRAFYDCKTLEYVFIPKTVNIIEGQAFIYCPNLTIYCEAELKPEGWAKNWKTPGSKVVWGYKRDKEEMKEPIISEAKDNEIVNDEAVDTIKEEYKSDVLNNNQSWYKGLDLDESEDDLVYEEKYSFEDDDSDLDLDDDESEDESDEKLDEAKE